MKTTLMDTGRLCQSRNAGKSTKCIRFGWQECGEHPPSLSMSLISLGSISQSGSYSYSAWCILEE